MKIGIHHKDMSENDIRYFSNPRNLVDILSKFRQHLKPQDFTRVLVEPYVVPIVELHQRHAEEMLNLTDGIMQDIARDHEPSEYGSDSDSDQGSESDEISVSGSGRF